MYAVAITYISIVFICHLSLRAELWFTMRVTWQRCRRPARPWRSDTEYDTDHSTSGAHVHRLRRARTHTARYRQHFKQNIDCNSQLLFTYMTVHEIHTTKAQLGQITHCIRNTEMLFKITPVVYAECVRAPHYKLRMPNQHTRYVTHLALIIQK